jgi:hypothetical protein
VRRKFAESPVIPRGFALPRATADDH